MAKFLFTWELGSGLGHLANLQPIVNGLSGRGHEVELALCNLDRCEDNFPSIRCRLAPLRLAHAGQHILEPSTFAEILYNAGCDHGERLATLVTEWREIFDDVRPDVLVAEFSPVAFLAAQGTEMKIVQMGTGHAWPPDVSPLPDLCPWRNNYPDRLAMIEQRVLEVINKHLAEQGQPRVDHVAELFARAQLQLLTTFPEMDHYPDRVGGNYVGNWSHLDGDKPEWPAGKKPRVFCYLKTPVAITTVLKELARREISTLAFVPEREKLKLPSERGSVRITSRPLDISAVARECDLAVQHTGHGTTLQLLLAGKPILALPLMGEQGIVAQNVARFGAGLSIEADNPPEILQGLNTLLSNDRYAQAARRFRDKYAEFNREAQIERVLNQLEQQIAGESENV
jgi:UDP:flavonoid glycosyltransferase YjiC (YdhE family)